MIALQARTEKIQRDAFLTFGNGVLKLLQKLLKILNITRGALLNQRSSQMLGEGASRLPLDNP